MEIVLRQELFDREMAPVEDWCPRCGGEIYHREELLQNDGLCRECAAETRNEEA